MSSGAATELLFGWRKSRARTIGECVTLVISVSSVSSVAAGCEAVPTIKQVGSQALILSDCEAECKADFFFLALFSKSSLKDKVKDL